MLPGLDDAAASIATAQSANAMIDGLLPPKMSRAVCEAAYHPRAISSFIDFAPRRHRRDDTERKDWTERMILAMLCFARAA
jgi:hypothetical protein